MCIQRSSAYRLVSLISAMAMFGLANPIHAEGPVNTNERMQQHGQGRGITTELQDMHAALPAIESTHRQGRSDGTTTSMTFNAVADTMLSSSEPTRNFGRLSSGATSGKEALMVGGDDRAGKGMADYRGLMRFDVSSVPPGATILSADLSLYHVARYDFDSTTRSLEAYVVRETWSETSVTWDSMPDSSSSASASISIPSGATGDQSVFRRYEGELSSSVVQAWISGAAANDGLLLRDDSSESAKAFRALGTREDGSTLVAQLTIEYTLDPPTPTQTARPSSTAQPSPTRTATPRPTTSPTPTFEPTPTSEPTPDALFLPMLLGSAPMPLDSISTVEPRQMLRWHGRAPVRFARFGMTAASDGAGIVYALGGERSSSMPPFTDIFYYDDLEAYDPATFSWSERAAIPEERSGIVLVGLEAGLLAIGGRTGDRLFPSSTNAVHEYFAASNEWVERADLPSSLFNAGAATGPDGKIFVFGGSYYYQTDPLNPISRSLGTLDTVYVYDPDKDAWTRRASMPTKSGHPAVAAGHDGLIFVLLGQSLHAYNPRTDVWEARRPMPSTRSGVAAAAAVNGRIFFVGGTDTDSAPLATVEEYDPITDTWASNTDLPTAREWGVSLAASGRSIFAIGGGTSNLVEEGMLP